MAGDNFETANLALPAYVAAALSFTAFLLVVFKLPESLDEEHRLALREKPRQSRLKEVSIVVKNSIATKILFIGAIYALASSLYDVIFPLWMSPEGTNIAFGPKDLIPFYLLSGVVVSVVQGGLMGPLSKRFGDHTLLRSSIIVYVLSLIALTGVGTKELVVWVFICMALASAAGSIVITCIRSLMSKTAGNTDRGIVMGVFSSFETVGRAIGTTAVGWMFHSLGTHSPMYIAGISMIVALVLGIAVKAQWHQLKAEPA